MEEERPLENYYFENLRKEEYQGSEIKLEKIIAEEEKYTSWLFSFQTEGKKVTGMVNLPEGEGPFPVVVMLRGYADEKIYFTGLGTRKAAGVFAQQGFATFAPDFLGFGGSDSSSSDVLEARFERPVTVLNLIASIEKSNKELFLDSEKLFLWGHSNGGQIALSVLEITKGEYPTVLWAPVTKGFPESITQYMDEDSLDEIGLKVKERIEEFVVEYDEKKVSIDEYFADIVAPIQLHQGGKDFLVPQNWSDAFVVEMKRMGKKIDYYQYPQSDHNLSPDWDEVVKRDIFFFKSFF